MNELVSISYSPWSEKARWALDHHGISYVKREYLPMLGEPALRLRTRRFRGHITVPVLFADRTTVADSFEIAQWAGAHGDGASLFPAGRDEEVRRWNEVSDRALAAARVLAMRRVGENRTAQLEALPRAVPRALRGASSALSASGLRWFARKYAFDAVDLAARREALDTALGEIQTAISDREYLLGEFSYADIVAAIALQLVSPVANEHIRLGEATRACCTDSELASKYSALVAWRDRLYARHRSRR